jgi:hypothetical protein
MRPQRSGSEEITMKTWYQTDEFEYPAWVCDLDKDLYSVLHRRLCVWADEFDGQWRWEIQTFDHLGTAGDGVSSTREHAMIAAETAALQMASWLEVSDRDC